MPIKHADSHAYPTILPSLSGSRGLNQASPLCKGEHTGEEERENNVIGLSPVVFCTQEGTHPPRSLTLDYRSPHPLSLSLPALCCNELQGKGGLCNPTRHKDTDGTELGRPPLIKESPGTEDAATED